MTDISITALQRDALQAAAIRNDGTIFPVRGKPSLNAGSVAKLMKTLIAKGLAEERPAEGKTPVWHTTDDGRRIAVVITAEGLSAIGMAPVGKAGGRTPAVGKKASVAAEQGVVAAVSPNATRMPRAGTKLAVLIELLGRKQGVTIAELGDATSWQAHTIRGTMSGALVKRFALSVTSETIEGRGRVYRLRS